MSFFEFMKRMATGEPIFEAEADNKAEKGAEPPQEKPNSMIRKGDASSFPVVYVKQVKLSPDSPTRIRLYGWIENTWPEQIMLDKIIAFGVTRELDTVLSGNSEKDFLLYEGPPMKREYHEAELLYKTQQEGDYFKAVHEVRFTYRQADKLYEVSEMQLRHPVIDIYG